MKRMVETLEFLDPLMCSLQDSLSSIELSVKCFKLGETFLKAWFIFERIFY